MKDKKIPPLTRKELLLIKRKNYMKKYYARKKAERIKSGEFVSICRGKIKRKEGNKFFQIKRGEFIVNFR